jgi:hypothetical protein
VPRSNQGRGVAQVTRLPNCCRRRGGERNTSGSKSGARTSGSPQRVRTRSSSGESSTWRQTSRSSRSLWKSGSSRGIRSRLRTGRTWFGWSCGRSGRGQTVKELQLADLRHAGGRSTCPGRLQPPTAFLVLERSGRKEGTTGAVTRERGQDQGQHVSPVEQRAQWRLAPRYRCPPNFDSPPV